MVTKTATPAVLAADQTPQEAAKARDVLITEIMAARNTALVGQDGVPHTSVDRNL